MRFRASRLRRIDIVSPLFVPSTGRNSVTVLFGTLGWRPQSLMPSIKSTEGLERVVFYHSAHDKSRAARSKVMTFCAALGVPATPGELSDPFDLLGVAGRVRQYI